MGYTKLKSNILIQFCFMLKASTVYGVKANMQAIDFTIAPELTDISPVSPKLHVWPCGRPRVITTHLLYQIPADTNTRPGQ